MPLPGNPKPVTPEKALRRLELQCAKAEMCSCEALEKMKRWGLSSRDAESVLDSLTSRRFIDDSRYASAFVRDRYRFKRWGRRKIAYALSLKRIPRPVIQTALESIDVAEYETILRGLIRTRIGMMDASVAKSFEGRTKLFRMAVSRGYEPELIARILREPSEEE